MQNCVGSNKSQENQLTKGNTKKKNYHKLLNGQILIGNSRKRRRNNFKMTMQYPIDSLKLFTKKIKNKKKEIETK